jgi:hypothetical protein
MIYTLHKTSDPSLFKMTFSFYEYFSAHQPINSGKGNATSTTQGTMATWNASRKGICFPTFFDRLALDMDMGEIIISMSNKSKSMSIRASSPDVGS